MKNTMELLKAFANLSMTERKVVDHLYNNPNLIGGYTDLTLDLGERADYSPNVRRAVIHLVDICVLSKSKVVIEGRTMKNIFRYTLHKDWENNLIKNGTAFKKYYGRAGKPTT